MRRGKTFERESAGLFMTRSVRLASVLFVAAAAMSAAHGKARAEERIISMYHVHTKERITVTYWKDGRFIPSALKKLNWFLRDWRRNVAVRIDPRTIDLIWKLHEDLGSKKPIHIISGHRSAKTNAMLRRIGRNVARRSRHITGQAIDFRFPDVPTWKVRNLALAYGIGGVGYYGRNGFVHVDTGRVRHWPRIPRKRLAAIISQYKRYIGYRNRRPGSFLIAARQKNRGIAGGRVIRIANAGGKARARGVTLAERAGARAKAKAPVTAVRRPAGGGKGPVPLVRPVQLAAAGQKNVPLPKARPYEVIVQAAAHMEIVPASAPATETNFNRSRSGDPLGQMIARVLPDELLEEEPRAFRLPEGRQYPRVNRSGKGDLAVAILRDEAPGVPTIRIATAERVQAANVLGNDIGALIRRTGIAPLASAENAAGRGKADPLRAPRLGPDGEDMAVQRVNRAEKGDLLVDRLRRVYAMRKVPLNGTPADEALHSLSGEPMLLRR
jgi:uncharacterized protein YcbK (DUF882 family)